jgi:hypothetical protein
MTADIILDKNTIREFASFADVWKFSDIKFSFLLFFIGTNFRSAINFHGFILVNHNVVATEEDIHVFLSIKLNFNQPYKTMNTTTSVDTADTKSEPVMDIESRLELLQFLLALTMKLNGIGSIFELTDRFQKVKSLIVSPKICNDVKMIVCITENFVIPALIENKTPSDDAVIVCRHLAAQIEEKLYQ